jgi:hypothetical protein
MLKKGRVKQILAAMLLCVLAAAAYTPNVQAGPQQSNSTNYGVSEVNFGSGGELHACSTAYCAKQSAGELTAGNTASTSFQAQAGFNTNREELLEVSVTGGAVDIGTLSPSAVTFGSVAFSVRNYLASGYAVILAGQAPTNKSGHTLTPMSSAGTSSPGTEQFGVNLKSNSSPAVGVDPVQIPDSSFSFGAASTGYNTANNFKFASGDTIAASPTSSGETDYTLSFIENITTNSSAGQYAAGLSVIVVSTF